jgi:hypothetical protein
MSPHSVFYKSTENRGEYKSKLKQINMSRYKISALDSRMQCVDY